VGDITYCGPVTSRCTRAVEYGCSWDQLHGNTCAVHGCEQGVTRTMLVDLKHVGRMPACMRPIPCLSGVSEFLPSVTINCTLLLKVLQLDPFPLPNRILINAQGSPLSSSQPPSNQHLANPDPNQCTGRGFEHDFTLSWSAVGSRAIARLEALHCSARSVAIRATKTIPLWSPLSYRLTL
jgi:hypothetical protein